MESTLPESPAALFRKNRCMNDKGCLIKFDVRAYIDKVNRLSEQGRLGPAQIEISSPVKLVQENGR